MADTDRPTIADRIREAALYGCAIPSLSYKTPGHWAGVDIADLNEHELNLLLAASDTTRRTFLLLVAEAVEKR